MNSNITATTENTFPVPKANTSIDTGVVDELEAQIAAAIEKLTEKQRRFCEAYVTEPNSTKAAIQSSYSEKTAFQIGYENLRKPEIAHAIALMRRALQLRNGVDPAYKRSVLIELLRRALNENDPQTVIKAIDILNRMDGDYMEKIELNISLESEIRKARERAGIVT